MSTHELKQQALDNGIDKMAKFLIIDDHPLFREALHSAIDLTYPDADTTEVASLVDAVDVLSSDSTFDLALLDLSMPGVRGYDGLLELRSEFPRLPVVIVSGHEEAKIIQQVIALGAAGFIPKSARKNVLADAIARVMEGEVYLPATYSKPVLEENDEERQLVIEKIRSLTASQLRVLNMLRNGLLNKQIAFELGVSETTVKAHVSEILRKLDVISRTAAVIEVSKLTQHDLVSLDFEHGPDNGTLQS